MSTDEREALARSTRTAPSLLVELASDGRVGVRVAAAANERTPARALTPLADDRSSKVRAAVAGNPDCPGRALTRLGQDKAWRVRHAVAGNRASPVSVLRKLARDTDARVLEVLVQNPSTPRAVVATALRHRGTRRLRGLAAANPSIPADELREWLSVWHEGGQDLEPLVDGISRRPQVNRETALCEDILTRAAPRLALRLPHLTTGQVRDLVPRAQSVPDLEALAWHPLANRQILKGILAHPLGPTLDPGLLLALNHEVRSAGAVRSRQQGEILVLRDPDAPRREGLTATSWAHRQLIRLLRQQAQPGPGLRLLDTKPDASSWYYGISNGGAEPDLFAVGAEQRKPGEVSLAASGLTVFVHRELAASLAEQRLAYEPTLRREGFQLDQF